ncbi:MAG: hypothetical protein ACO1N2_02900 [Candidatus Saccharimonadota bacterium]
MKTNKASKRIESRNWALVFIASILILIGAVLTILSVAYVGQLGWWSLLIGLGGVATVFLAVMSIVKNDSSWILLGLFTPY